VGYGLAKKVTGLTSAEQTSDISLKMIRFLADTQKAPVVVLFVYLKFLQTFVVALC
jgi:hypothetical protein